jgi:hypothetical protein
MARCVPKNGPLPRHDLWIDQMSLPRLFQTRPDCIPFAGGYLRPDPRKVAAWNRDLPFGRRIGLVWAGNPAHSNDHRRSLPTEALDILAPARPGTCFIGLQVGPRQGEADGRFGGAPGYVNMSARLTDYGETAAALTCLDLLISVDTSVVHLAGALGCPAWVLLPHAPDWRWLSDRDDSPWYRSLRLFRQTRPGDWSEPLRQVASALS